MGFVANYICFPAVQKLWKSVKVWQSYRQLKVGTFLETQCTFVFFCLTGLVFRVFPPLPSNRHHRSNGDCLEGKRENYQVSVFCAILCATIVHSAMHTHINRPDSSLDWVLSHWAHFTVLRFIFVFVLFSILLYIACMCRTVTWWGGPGGIEAYPYADDTRSRNWRQKTGVGFWRWRRFFTPVSKFLAPETNTNE